MKAFAHIFRREGIKAEVIEGDSFHRYARIEMRERVAAADSGKGPPISHFGPEANLLAELADTFAEYGATGGGKLRRYVHDAIEAKELQDSKLRLTNIIARHTGQSAEKVLADCERNFYLSAEEAKAYGIIDEVIKRKK